MTDPRTDPRLNPAGPYKREPPPPHELRDRQTATSDTIVLCHFGVPGLDRERWSLTIDGLVDRPAELSFDRLLAFPKAEVRAVHQCCGSPFEPFRPMRRVANVRWAGARLADILEQCLPRETAKFVWSFGADSGQFGGVSGYPYAKDLPLDRIDADVLVAYELNGAALPAEHGYPARLVVPGFYGTNSVKWLCRITLADRRAEGPFTTKWYADPQVDQQGRPTGRTTPVWSIAPEALIVAPAAASVVELGAPQQVWG